ncbi:MAG TPA: hypothetical protein VNM92_15480 [Thermoanaerobaculia bacterium]|nr:hypothetical protein [Thermoanaerobaculia bacterium]
MSIKSRFVLIAAFLIAVNARAQIPVDCAMAGSWGERGITRDLAVRDGRAYVADGKGLTVYDISDPRNIRKLASSLTSSATRKVVATATTVYALTGAALEVYAVGTSGEIERRESRTDTGADHIDASGTSLVTAGAELQLYRSTAAGLELVSRLTLPERATAVKLAGNLVVVATSREILIFNASANELRELARLVGSAVDLDFADNLLYLVDGTNGLAIYDLHDPANPRFLGTVGRTIRDLRSLTVIGKTVYASSAASELDVYDVSNPLSPTLRSSFIEPSAVVASDGELLYVAGSFIDKYRLTTPSGKPLRIFSPRESSAPTLVGELQIVDSPITGVASDGNYAYVSDPPYFRVIDVRTPSNPVEVASFTIADAADKVGLHGKFAYLFGRGNVHLIDVSDPKAPRETGVFLAQGVPPSGAGFAGDYLIEANNGSGLHVVDISDPSRPTQIAGLKYDSLGQFSSAFGRPGVAYGVLPSGIRVADISNPHFARHVRVLDIPFVRAALIAPELNGRAETLIIQRGDLLSFYEMSDPLLPTEIATLPLAGGSDISFEGNTAHVVTKGGELFRVDFSQPRRPVITHELRGLIDPQQIWSASGLVFVADTYSLRILRDLANVTVPGPCEFKPPVVSIPPIPPIPPPLRSRPRTTRRA